MLSNAKYEYVIRYCECGRSTQAGHDPRGAFVPRSGPSPEKSGRNPGSRTLESRNNK